MMDKIVKALLGEPNLPSMEDPPWRTNDMDIADEVYDELEPMDGYDVDSRGGPRPYSYRGKWWVVISVSDFGDLSVGQWGQIKEGWE